MGVCRYQSRLDGLAPPLAGYPAYNDTILLMPTKLMIAAVKKHPLFVFFALAFLIATPAFITTSLAADVAVQLPLLILGSYAPTIATLVVLALLREPVESQAWRQRLRIWRVSAIWYLVAGLVPTGTWISAVAVMTLLGKEVPIQLASLLVFPVILITNLGEEFGWRGFALPRLMTAFRPLPAGLVLGLIWGLFHIPLYWDRPLFALVFIVLALALSVFLAWLFVHTGGSVLLCTLFHAVYNTWSQAFLTAQGSEGILAMTAVVLWVVVGFLVVRYGVDLSRTSAAPTSAAGTG